MLRKELNESHKFTPRLRKHATHSTTLTATKTTTSRTTAIAAATKTTTSIRITMMMITTSTTTTAAATTAAASSKRCHPCSPSSSATNRDQCDSLFRGLFLLTDIGFARSAFIFGTLMHYNHALSYLWMFEPIKCVRLVDWFIGRLVGGLFD